MLGAHHLQFMMLLPGKNVKCLNEEYFLQCMSLLSELRKTSRISFQIPVHAMPSKKDCEMLLEEAHFTYNISNVQIDQYALDIIFFMNPFSHVPIDFNEMINHML
jgi:hypothetical protein